jgi:hypothetical protein
LAWPPCNSASIRCADPGGALWFVNSNNSIGRITTTGTVTSYQGHGIYDPLQITTAQLAPA